MNSKRVSHSVLLPHPGQYACVQAGCSTPHMGWRGFPSVFWHCHQGWGWVKWSWPIGVVLTASTAFHIGVVFVIWTITSTVIFNKPQTLFEASFSLSRQKCLSEPRTDAMPLGTFLWPVGVQISSQSWLQVRLLFQWWLQLVESHWLALLLLLHFSFPVVAVNCRTVTQSSNRGG